MNKSKLAFYIFAALTLGILIVYFLLETLRPKFAGLYIVTNPKSTVYINGDQKGQTPYRGVNKPGEVVIKLTPDNVEKKLSDYESKIDLIAGVETVVRYDFAETESDASGDVISFEKDMGGLTSLIAVSVPDSAIIVIDNRTRAFAPYKTTNISPGNHELKFILDGYQERIVKVKIHKGYKLSAFVKLARGGEAASPAETSTPTSEVVDFREKVEIQSNPMGYLRVRKDAATTSDEIGRVSPGEKYPLLEVDLISGWYKIEIFPETASEEAKTGWISNQYAKKITPNVSPTPIPTPANPPQ